MSSEPGNGYLIFPGGMAQMTAVYERRRGPIIGREPFGLPQEDCDLLKAFVTAVNPADKFNFSFTNTGRGWSKKLTTLASEFQGQSEAECLHAYCIAHLRRRQQPAAARTIFLRLWHEYDEDMVELLPVRWLVSAMATFADHGENEEQRLAGAGFNFFFGMLKLYEFERRAVVPEPQRYGRYSDMKTPMPLDLGRFSLPRGDLDLAILGRLAALCNNDEPTALIGYALLEKLNQDPGTIFARFAKVKDPDMLTYPLAPGPGTVPKPEI